MFSKLNAIGAKALRISNGIGGEHGKKNYEVLVCNHITRAKKHVCDYVITREKNSLVLAHKALKTAANNSNTFYNISL